MGANATNAGPNVTNVEANATIVGANATNVEPNATNMGANGKRLRVYTLPFIVKVLTFAP